MKKLFFAALMIGVLAAAGCSRNADSTVLARVNRAQITVADFKQHIADLPPQMQQAVATDAKARKDFLDDLVGIEVVLQEARRRGLDKDAEFKRKVDEFVKNELFNGLLKKELAGKVSFPTDQEVKEYYNKHRAEMRTAAGKQLSFAEAGPQLRSWLYQQRQRQAYLDFAKGLKEKARVKIDEKALEAAGAALSQPSMEQGLKLQHPPLPSETGK